MGWRENVSSNRPELRDRIADYFHAGDQGVMVADLVDKRGRIKPAYFTDEVFTWLSYETYLNRLHKSDQEFCSPRPGDPAWRRVNGLERPCISPLYQTRPVPPLWSEMLPSLAISSQVLLLWHRKWGHLECCTARENCWQERGAVCWASCCSHTGQAWSTLLWPPSWSTSLQIEATSITRAQVLSRPEITNQYL